jgi:hypothetical protein
MFGIGMTELLIFLVIAGGMFAAVCVAVVLMIAGSRKK